MPGAFHFGSIGVKHSLVVCGVIFCKNFMQLWIRRIAVGGAGFLCHLDSAERHERAFQGFVSLKTHYLFQVFHFFADITGFVGSKGGHDFSVHVQDAALCPFFFLELLKLAPQRVCRFRGTGQKGRVSLVGGVVVLNEIPDVYFLFPEPALKSIPLFLMHCHNWYLLKLGGSFSPG